MSVSPAPNRPLGTPRIPQLDILRALAIVLVLGHHFAPEGPWQQVGWIGVDLFFVLSGFLVSGLLFAEYHRTGSLDIRRFLVRRAFKIYPSFWALALTTALVSWTMAQKQKPIQWFCELAFIQNYGPSIWMHTWSLAVEEHFYLGIAVILWLMRRRGGKNPFHDLPTFAVVFLVLVLILRCVSVAFFPARFKMNTFGTHLRADALTFGVIVAYLYHYRRDSLHRFVASHRLLLALTVVVGLAPTFCVENTHPFIRSVGFTLIYLAFGSALLLFLLNDWFRLLFTSLGGRLLAALGAYSYNIYLWHIPVAIWLIEDLWFPDSTGQQGSYLWLKVASAILVGVLMTTLIEGPMLAARDRLFPRQATGQSKRDAVAPVAVYSSQPSF